MKDHPVRTEPDVRNFDLAIRYKCGKKKGTGTVGSTESKGFTQSVINIFRLNMFEESQAKKNKHRSRTPKNQLSKTTTIQRDRVKKLKKMVARRKEEQKKKKLWKDYLERLAKGKLVKGEKAPF